MIYSTNFPTVTFNAYASFVSVFSDSIVTGTRRKGRIEKGMGASHGGVF